MLLIVEEKTKTEIGSLATYSALQRISVLFFSSSTDLRLDSIDRFHVLYLDNKKNIDLVRSKKVNAAALVWKRKRMYTIKSAAAEYWQYLHWNQRIRIVRKYLLKCICCRCGFLDSLFGVAIRIA